MAKIKICGITNATDAQLAAKFGADALGFNFYAESPRYISPERARAIIASLPPFICPVGIFVDEPPETIQMVCESCGIYTVQLHGNEPPETVGKLRAFQVIKAIRVQSERDLNQLRRYDVDGFVLDTYMPNMKGGTGVKFNWELAKSVTHTYPVILAGGLTPENVQDAIRTVRPYGVDVCTGVESKPGKKDRERLKKFILLAREAFLAEQL